MLNLPGTTYIPRINALITNTGLCSDKYVHTEYMNNMKNMHPSIVLEKLGAYCRDNFTADNFIYPLVSIHSTSGNFGGKLVQSDDYSCVVELIYENEAHGYAYIASSSVQAVAVINAGDLQSVLGSAKVNIEDKITNIQLQRSFDVIREQIHSLTGAPIRLNVGKHGDSVVNSNMLVTAKNLTLAILEMTKEGFSQDIMSDISEIVFSHEEGYSLHIAKNGDTVSVNNNFLASPSLEQPGEIKKLLIQALS